MVGGVLKALASVRQALGGKMDGRVGGMMHALGWLRGPGHALQGTRQAWMGRG